MHKLISEERRISKTLYIQDIFNVEELVLESVNHVYSQTTQRFTVNLLAMRLLLVEDDVFTVAALKKLLVGQQYQVDVAATGLVGWEPVKANAFSNSPCSFTTR